MVCDSYINCHACFCQVISTVNNSFLAMFGTLILKLMQNEHRTRAR